MNNPAANSIAQQLHWARTLLAGESARLDVEVLLAFVLNRERSYLYAWPETILPADLIGQFQDLVLQRQQGKPVAYLLGWQEFWSLSFQVSPATLIPRPETEQLVEAVLQHYGDKDNIHVLDAGTGSGVIAITLAHEKPDWQVYACDESFEALQLAQGNASYHHANVHFVNSDWLAPVQAGLLDVIVTNPPYIAEGDEHLAALQYEPQTALVAGNKGLADIRQIIMQAAILLKSGGRLYVEHGYDQAQAVQQLFRQHGFSDVSTSRDYAGCDRFSCGEKP